MTVHCTFVLRKLSRKLQYYEKAFKIYANCFHVLNISTLKYLEQDFYGEIERATGLLVLKLLIVTLCKNVTKKSSCKLSACCTKS